MSLNQEDIHETKLNKIQPQQGEITIQRRDPVLGNISVLIDTNTVMVPIYPVVTTGSLDIEIRDKDDNVLFTVTAAVV